MSRYDRHSSGGGGRDRDRGSWGGGNSYSDRGKGKGGGYGRYGGGGGGGGGGGYNDGEEDTSRDWECECGTRNFARRSECFKCKRERPAQPGAEKRERLDPRAERERKLKVAMAMGYEKEHAETIIMDPRFAESIQQYEKFQKEQEEAQKAQQEQMQKMLDAQQTQALMTTALASGMNMEQAQAYVAQQKALIEVQKKQAEELRKQQEEAYKKAQEEAEKAAEQAAEQAGQPDEAMLLAAALALGYTPEQAQEYVKSCMVETPAKSSGTRGPPGPPKAPEGRPPMYATTPQILKIEERKDQFRSTLKACCLTHDDGVRRFKDIVVKGPWRDSKDEAAKDEEELSHAFKFEGDDGAKEKVEELEKLEWRKEDIDEFITRTRKGGDNVEDDDFDAEAESEEEPEDEVTFDNDQMPVRVKGAMDPQGPINSWQEGVSRGCIHPSIMASLQGMGMVKPTQIQRYSCPLVGFKGSDGRFVDLLAQAQTGSGKTMAFVVPVVSRLLANPPVERPFFAGFKAQASPVCVMLSPTRELAIQTSKNTLTLLQNAGSTMSVLTMYGGEAMSQQVKPIESAQQDIICATAGRLLDAVDSSRVSLMFCENFVLDEADQMMDLTVGLEGTVMALSAERDMPRKHARQTLLFSATMPEFQTRQFHSVLKKPPMRVKLRIGHYNEDERGGSCRHIDQMFFKVRDLEDRWRRMGDDIREVWGRDRQSRQGKGIVFTNRIALAQPLQNALSRIGISAGQLHGKQTQHEREDIVKKFREGEYEMLIASNVASRGLDFPDIRLVVQFELPKTVEIYTHRIGRTGRNGQPGTAFAYFGIPHDWGIAKPLVEFLELNEQKVPSWMDEFANPEKKDSRRDRSRSRDRDRDRRR